MTIGSSLGAASAVLRGDLPDRPADHPAAGRTLSFDVRGIHLELTSNIAPVLEVVDATYAAFRDDDHAGSPTGTETLRFSLMTTAEGRSCLLGVPGGGIEAFESPAIGLLALLEAMVGQVVGACYRLGILAVHAGAVAGPSGATLIAGRSGQGKTTLVLGLVRHGFGLLSDELALLDPDAGLVHAYRRSAHVRPATLGLLPELQPLAGRATHRLGGGVEWTVEPEEVAGLLGGRLSDSAPLAAAIILDGAPDPTRAPRLTEIAPAVASLELLRTTWAASVDFSGTLSTLGTMLAEVPCFRLAVGDFEATVATVAERLERGRG